jgi:signal-transduction protein with cAMP-binding, CBS, and nucleotidyltransferase domain
MVTVDSHVKVDEVAKAMVESEVESILVFENSDVVGIVTLKDMLTDILAKGKDPAKTTILEITHKPIISINENATVKEAINLMNKNNIRRLVVKNQEKSVGMISQRVVIGNLGKFSAVLPELEIPNKIRCPYCSSLFEDKKSLSHHIDDIHIGRGLLEGNLEQAGKLGSIKTPGNPRSL